MFRFRLIWLFAATALVALILGAVVSHHRAKRQFQLCFSEVCSAIKETSPQINADLISELKLEVKKNETFLAHVERYSPDDAQRVLDSLVFDGISGGTTNYGGLFSGDWTRELILSITVQNPMTDFSTYAYGGRDEIKKVLVLIRCRTPWSVFAGPPRVTIIDRGASENPRFIELLSEALDRRKIAYEIRN